ncbi:MAG: nucleoside transporter C-terminal domain-containing protein [Terriglobia bacterium]|jgi:CNT family concentrative nucleoside transporter|nr:nucleoside transporter C-terminal domain-containing protein [Terriglobia bacterium]
MAILRGLLGLAVIIGLAWAFSTKRRAINWRTVGTGVTLQIFFAFLVLKWTYGREMITAAGAGINKLLDYSFYGSNFVFGELGKKASTNGFIFAFQVLPTIIFIAAFFAILYHFGVMQFVINIAAKLMQRLMGVSGVESLDVAASIFMGQTEAPLTIRPFLSRVTNSELMVIMTAGMAHVSGGIMGAYILSGIEAKHLLTAVIMTAPGTLTIAKMLVPETEVPETSGKSAIQRDEEEKHENVLAATAKGTSDGLSLAINVAAMLISFLALIYLLNGILGGIHNVLIAHGFRWFPSSLESIFGFVFAPVAWLIGVPWHDCRVIGNLLGTRMALNELVAFTMLGPMKGTLDPRSFTIATFALCGFANISSIGIQIGGLGALAPNRRGDLARLGFRAMIAGTMANLMSAAIVGMFL